MEQASGALARMDYFDCERKCLQAFAAARDDGRWAYLARVLMPLQEARRQLRMLAAEGEVVLGADDALTPRTGLMVLDTAAKAREAYGAARIEKRPLEVLFVPRKRVRWTVRSFAGLELEVQVEPPAAPHGSEAARWFIETCETHGDALLRHAEAIADPHERRRAFERAIEAAPHHEKLHQHFADHLRDMVRQGCGSSG